MRLIYLFPNNYAKKSANRIQTVNFAYALDKQLKDEFVFITGSGYGDNVLNELGISKKSKNHIEINFKYKKGLTLQFVYELFKRGFFQEDNVFYMRDYTLLKILAFLKKMKIIKNQLIFELHEVPTKDILNSLKYIDKFVVISNAIKNDLPLFLKQKPILTAHDGFNSQNIVTYDNEILNFDLSNSIIYIGTYQEWKNIEYIVQLAQILKDINFILIGVDKIKIKENISNMDNLKFIDYMNHKDIYSVLFYTKFAIYTLNPKFSIAKYTSPLKLFEYLSFGITVFAPNYSSVKEVLVDKNNAYLYDIENIDKTAKLIKNVVMENKALNETIIKKSVEKYSWDNRATEVITFAQS